jgi:RNase P subunit RPR2
MPLRRFTLCESCSSPLAARVWREAAKEGQERVLWHCPVCAAEFETVESSTSRVDDKEAVDVFWPTLLVA